MKKTTLMLLTIVLLTLTGCTAKSATATFANKHSDASEKSVLAQNKQVWDKKTAQLTTKVLPKGEENCAVLPENLTELKTSGILVKAKVMNLTALPSKNTIPETKITLKVSQILSDNKKLPSKAIEVPFKGGISDDQKELVNDQDSPLPKVGDTLIVLLNHDESGQFHYQISDPEYLMWKKDTYGKFVPNNPDQSTWNSLKSVTSDINQKIK